MTGRKGDFFCFEVEGRKFFWVADTMQIFPLADGQLDGFFGFLNGTEDPPEIKVPPFLQQAICEGIQPLFAKETSPNTIMFNLDQTHQEPEEFDYCFAYFNQVHRMKDLKSAVRAVNWIVENAEVQEDIAIVFTNCVLESQFGFITQFVDYFEETMRGKLLGNVSYVLQMRKTFLNEEHVCFFRENPFHLIMEMTDEPAYPREGKSFSYRNWIKEVVSWLYFGVNLSVQLHLPSRIPNQLCQVYFLEEHRVPFGFSLVCNRSTERQGLPGVIFDAEQGYKGLATFYLERVKSGVPLSCETIRTALIRIHFQIGKKYGCGAGRGNFSISTNEQIYSCPLLSQEYFVSRGCQKKDQFSPKGNSVLKSQSVSQKPICLNCWARYLCGGGCFALHLIEGKREERLQYQCLSVRSFWKEILILYQGILQEKPLFFETIEVPVVV